MFNADKNTQGKAAKRAKTGDGESNAHQHAAANPLIIMNDANVSDRQQNNISTVSSSAASSSSTTTKMAVNMLTLLDENSLLQILVRTCSEDHKALRNTCRSFRTIIDSALFRQERAQREWAHVATAVSPHPLFGALGDMDIDNGCITNNFEIVVDGLIAGGGSYTLIGRSKGINFHEVCDEISQEIMETGCLFFDKRGRPRLPTLKKAMAASSTSHYRHEHLQGNYLMYLNTFSLNPEYRRNNATWVGANALCSLLLDSPLKERWEVVIYMADSRSHFTEQDEAQNEILRRRSEDEEEENERVLRENSDWDDRLQSLAKDDLRQFLRCGFEQATDSVPKSDGLYVFAVPAFLDDHHRPMLTHQQTMALNIVDKKQLLSPENRNFTMSVDETKLLKFMVTSCIKRRSICEKIAASAQSEALATALATTHADLARHDSGVKAEIGRLVGGAAGEDGAATTIRNSNSIHACAAQMTPEYIDLLLEFLPVTERRSLLNKFDSTGLTPLMVAASVSRFSDQPELRYRTAEHLIDLGANKNITEACGETALGRFRDMRRSMTDREDVHDMDDESNRRHAESMERLLRPIGGPTAADDACLDTNDDDDDDDDDSEVESDVFDVFEEDELDEEEEEE
jgi:hypothetical protein